MLPIAREILQLGFRTNLMFFYFEGDFQVSYIAVWFLPVEPLYIDHKLFSLQAYIIIYQNVLPAFNMYS